LLEAKIDADSLILAVRPDLDLANKVAVPTATRILGEVCREDLNLERVLGLEGDADHGVRQE
jgi:hypothetical protein